MKKSNLIFVLLAHVSFLNFNTVKAQTALCPSSVTVHSSTEVTLNFSSSLAYAIGFVSLAITGKGNKSWSTASGIVSSTANTVRLDLSINSITASDEVYGMYIDESTTNTYFTCNTNFTLPVTLVNFEGRLLNIGAILKWTTASEINNNYFEIERSTDGKIYSKIGEVKGNGNSNQLINYVFNDISLAESSYDFVFYRLKQIDFNGEFEYSKIIKLNRSKETYSDKIIVSPNPFENEIKVLLLSSDAGSTQIKLLNLLGEVIIETNYELDNEKSISLNTYDLIPGIYVLSVNHNGVILYQKIIKN